MTDLRLLTHAMAALALVSLAACAGGPRPQESAEMSHPEGAIFDPSIDAMAAVDDAMARAAGEGRLVLLVMGGNWCHDSRALASYLMEPRPAELVESGFVPVYINVGLPQTGDGHNLDVAVRFGMEVAGTPNMLVIDPEGRLLNTSEDAHSWRAAESRGADAVATWLESWVSPADI